MIPLLGILVVGFYIFLYNYNILTKKDADIVEIIKEDKMMGSCTDDVNVSIL